MSHAPRQTKWAQMPLGGAYGMREKEALSWHILVETLVNDDDDMMTMTLKTAMITQKHLINESGCTHATAYLTSCVNGNFLLGTLDFWTVALFSLSPTSLSLLGDGNSSTLLHKIQHYTTQQTRWLNKCSHNYRPFLSQPNLYLKVGHGIKCYTVPQKTLCNYHLFLSPYN
jgi:hypothetical protein